MQEVMINKLEHNKSSTHTAEFPYIFICYNPKETSRHTPPTQAAYSAHLETMAIQQNILNALSRDRTWLFIP
jgi:hypothetical protein